MLFNVILFVLAAGALAASYHRDRQKTKKALAIARKSFGNILPSMLGIIGLIGLMLALVPREIIAGLFGNNSPGGILLISLAGAVTLMPAFIAFPLAASLLQAGASVMAVAGFITTLLMVGIITAPMEIAYFGRKFTFWRNMIGFILALLIGAVMGVFLR
ncbi:MAG TPA: permease [Desulfotomaculum sp.]|nr:permease [Desulfotomaculum sp.]